MMSPSRSAGAACAEFASSRQPNSSSPILIPFLIHWGSFRVPHGQARAAARHEVGQHREQIEDPGVGFTMNAHFDVGLTHSALLLVRRRLDVLEVAVQLAK